MSGSFWSRGFARWKEQRRWRSIRQKQIQWDADEVRVIAHFKDGHSEREWSKAWAEVRKVLVLPPFKENGTILFERSAAGF